MCIAIFKDEGKELSPEILRTCWKANSDGAGFMYAEDGEVKIKKGFMTLESFLEAYEPHKEQKCVLHFRIRTHGPTNEENTHPFRVNKKLGFVHNGVISAVHTKDKAYSDTWHFNEQIIKPIVKKAPWMMDTAAVQMLITDFIGYSKLIFMNGKGEVTIYNEEKGYWEDGCWFSNKSYEPKKSYYRPSSTDVIIAPSQDSSPIPRMGDVVFTVVTYEAIPRDTYGTVSGFGESPFVWVTFSGAYGMQKVPAWAIQVCRVYKTMPTLEQLQATGRVLYDDDDDEDLFYQPNDLVILRKNYGTAKVDDVGIVMHVHKRACTVQLSSGSNLVIPNRFLELTWGN
jgi:hypothetical protein